MKSLGVEKGSDCMKSLGERRTIERRTIDLIVCNLWGEREGRLILLYEVFGGEKDDLLYEAFGGEGRLILLRRTIDLIV